MVVYIYVLKDPRTGNVRYVGKTVDPRARRKKHGSPSQVKGRRKRQWLLELRAIRLKPIFEIIEECDEHTWAEREEFWIAHYGGPDYLLNIRDSAIPGHFETFNRETKEYLRAKALEQFSDPEKRAAHQQAMYDWATTDVGKDACRRGGVASAATGKPKEGSHRFWASMSPEERECFIKERSAKQIRKDSTDAQFIENCAEAQKAVWQDEQKRANRIAGLKAAWADPVKRTARIAKNRIKRGLSP